MKYIFVGMLLSVFSFFGADRHIAVKRPYDDSNDGQYNKRIKIEKTEQTGLDHIFYAMQSPCNFANLVNACNQHISCIDERSSKNGDHTALGYAIEQGWGPIVQVLIAHGASVNTPSTQLSIPPLSLAIIANQGYLVQYLLANNADVTQKAHNGNTPLHEAVKIGHVGMVGVFLESIKNKALVNLKNKEGLTPLDMVKFSSKAYQEAMAKLLQENGARSTHHPFKQKQPRTIAMQARNPDN